jgi:hypothetical protein
MRTAVIYSGQARSFAQVFPNQYWHVLRKLKNPEFFVSVAKDDNADAMIRLYERFDPAVVHIEHVEQPQLAEPPDDPAHLSGYPRNASKQAILRQLWALNRAWQFYREKMNWEANYDIVVRLRPDLRFMRFEMPLAPFVYTPFVYTPWWSRWGGVNDRLAVMNEFAAERYFTTFTRLSETLADGAPLHPETLIAESLRGFSAHPLVAEFNSLRLDGTMTPFDPTVIDIADYAKSKL